MFRHGIRAAAAFTAAAALLTGRAGASDAGPAEKAVAVALTPAAIDWKPVPLVAGMASARVWGPADGAQARFVRMPAGGKLPLHKHTANVRVVVVSGAYVYAVEGEPERRYEAGSFIVTPGGVPHVAGCAEACVYYEEVDAKPDYVPVGEPK
jgi:quercetin dioxygenase-like cupin family protein